VAAVLSFQEFIVITMIVYKIKRASPPIKVQYLQNRFGSLDEDKKKKSD